MLKTSILNILIEHTWPLYLFEVRGQVGQDQSKILAKMSAVIGSMQCSNKKIFGQDFDRGRRSEYTAYASATPLIQKGDLISGIYNDLIKLIEIVLPSWHTHYNVHALYGSLM